MMTQAPPGGVSGNLDFMVSDVTGLHVLNFEDVDGHRSTSEVAASIASLMDLPPNIPYALRDEARAKMLVDDSSLGSQVDPGAKLVLTPKVHLG